MWWKWLLAFAYLVLAELDWRDQQDRLIQLQADCIAAGGTFESETVFELPWLREIRVRCILPNGDIDSETIYIKTGQVPPLDSSDTYDGGP